MHGIGLPGVSKSAKITFADRLYLFLAHLRDGLRSPVVMLGVCFIAAVLAFGWSRFENEKLQLENIRLQHELSISKVDVEFARQQGLQDAISALQELQAKSLDK